MGQITNEQSNANRPETPPPPRHTIVTSATGWASSFFPPHEHGEAPPPGIPAPAPTATVADYAAMESADPLLEQLESQIATLQHDIAISWGQINECKTRLDQQRSHLAVRAQDLDNKEKMLSMLGKELEQRAMQLSEQAARQEHKQTELDAGLRRVGEYESKHRSRETELDSRCSELTRLATELEGERKDVERFSAQFDEKRSELESLKNAAESDRSAAQAERQSAQHLKAELESREADASAREDRLGEIEADLQQRRETLGNAHLEISRTRESLAREKDALESQHEAGAAVAGTMNEWLSHTLAAYGLEVDCAGHLRAISDATGPEDAQRLAIASDILNRARREMGHDVPDEPSEPAASPDDNRRRKTWWRA